MLSQASDTTVPSGKSTHTQPHAYAVAHGVSCPLGPLEAPMRDTGIQITVPSTTIFHSELSRPDRVMSLFTFDEGDTGGIGEAWYHQCVLVQDLPGVGKRGDVFTDVCVDHEETIKVTFYKDDMAYTMNIGYFLFDLEVGPDRR